MHIRNGSDCSIRYGGFIIGAHESLSFETVPGMNTLNSAHWQEKGEELELLSRIHAGRAQRAWDAQQ